tara:strand:+ start:140 stop:583 length:444 start_codon:yes stop_codon:yes gene_type:complete
LKNYFKIIILIFIISSCVEENPDNKIEISPLEDIKFQKIIKKIWLMNAYIYNNNNTLMLKDSLGKATYKLLKDNGVDKYEFEKSIQFYSQNPILLDSIIRDLKDSLEKAYNEILDSELIEKKNINSTDSLKENFKFKSRIYNKNTSR